MAQNSKFNTLDKNKQTAIILLFEDDLTDEKIAKNVNRSRTTLNHWKNDPIFIEAQREYRNIAFDGYVPNAIKELGKLASNAKSEMVRLQAINTILSMAKFGSAERNVELDDAQVRKTIAEAKIKEAQAELITGGGELPDDGFMEALKGAIADEKD